MPKLYREGKAVISSGGAFVNSAAKLTRDVGLAIAAQLGGGYSVLDCTSATGIRGIRYSLEAGAGSCTMLEINRTAFSSLKRNVARNRVCATALNTSVQEFANSCGEKFDVIDLDPFGSVQPYLNDLMKLAMGGTLLFATATDTAVLCGAHHGACLRVYGSVPMHNELCKEAGIRILVGQIARTASQFNFGIRPLLSMNYRHYMRVHVRIEHGQGAASKAVKSIGFIFYCNGCGERGTLGGLIPNRLDCPACGARLQLAGPLWTGSMQDTDTLKVVCERCGDGSGTLSRLCGEIDTPVLYSIPKMTKRLGMRSVSPSAVIAELKGAGHDATLAHFDPSYVRTGAGAKEMAESVRKAEGRQRGGEG